MIQKPMDVLQQFPVRKSKTQKQDFRSAVVAYLATLGYSCRTEQGIFGSQNLVIGDPTKASFLVTAHYDTCARMLLPNLITPCNPWAFIGYQLFITLFMLGIPVIPGALVGAFTNFETGYLVWYFSFIATFMLMMLGPANPNNANDNTSGVVTLLEIAKSLPQEQRSKVCFVLFDMEELGLIGSKSYRNAHKIETDRQIILNLDCVGDGDHLMVFPTKKLLQNSEMMAFLWKLNDSGKEKSINVHSTGFSVYPSDQRNFPYGAGIAAFKSKKGIGLYCDKIHTAKDTWLDENNVNMLRDRIIAAITE